MVFQPDGDITSGTKCDLIQLGMQDYLGGLFCGQEVNDYIHEHLNSCDECHKQLFKVAFPEG